MSARCRILGHRWRFAADGRILRWTCLRCATVGGERRYESAADARKLARHLETHAPGPPRGLLAALAGQVPPRERDGR